MNISDVCRLFFHVVCGAQESEGFQRNMFTFPQLVTMLALCNKATFSSLDADFNISERTLPVTDLKFKDCV